jgi:hypothetical protein
MSVGLNTSSGMVTNPISVYCISQTHEQVKIGFGTLVRTTVRDYKKQQQRQLTTSERNTLPLVELLHLSQMWNG